VNLFQNLRRRRTRVLFVCLGNTCRSQMAEALARAYGHDVLDSHSAGIRPATRISRRTVAVMEEKSVHLGSSFAPKPISSFDLNQFDVIVNLSEYNIPNTTSMVLRRALRDVRADVEQLVCYLTEHFRSARQPHLDPLYSEECAAAS
jgi:protein-tyrosine-phosphatase